LYRSMPNERFVDVLARNAGITLGPAERAALIDKMNSGVVTRGQAMLNIVNTRTFVEEENTRSLVLLHYFGYLHRNPDDPPDNTLDGFYFWIKELEQSGDAGRLTRGFMASGEYVDRKDKR